jgi:hypothetical protein
MRKISNLVTGAWVAALFILSGSSARADQISVLAFDNATVQPAGPRPGDNGKRFFNMEGNQSGMFASFGVADFTFPHHDEDGEESEIESIRSLTVTLVQANAAFTADGALHFWLTTDTNTDIQPSDTPAVKFIREDDPDGLDQQLAPRFFLGSGMFVQVDDGQVDTFSFRLSRQARQYLRRQISRGGTVRIVISPANGTVAATYAGFSNDEFTGPTLTIGGED